MWAFGCSLTRGRWYWQFFITVALTPHLDKRHVVFGEVASGYDIIKKCEAVGSAEGKTSQEVLIADCGVL